MKLNNYTLLPNLCSIIIMLITTNLTAQNYFPWYKTYGESGRAIDICQTVDSGYVVAGENYQYYPHRVWLLHTDYLGDTLWSKVYDNICNDDDHLFVRAVIQAADGGYVILSNCIDQYLSTKDILLLKTNQQGDLEFLGRYERGYVYDFLETKDGGFIIAGEISGDAALLKVNSQGDSIWTQIYGIGDRSYALSIKALTDSEYVVTGSVEVGISPSDKNVFILKINSTGDTLISRIFENPNSNDFVISVDVTDYGNYIVAGRTESHLGTNKMFIMKIDSMFNEVWKTYTQSYMSTKDAINYKSNSYLLVGNAGPPYLDIVICEVDSLGNILYYRLFDIFSAQHAYSVIKKTDTSYVIVGDINGPKLLIFEGTDNPIITASENIINTMPIDYYLSQNYPNPFNPSTKIKFTIPTSPLNPSPYQGEGQRERLITLIVYDVLGNEIATLVNEEKPAGKYEVEFNSASSIRYPASGIYFYQLRAGEFIQTKKMILLR